jgi:pimeloyl-ACP methyl ester carboxylesterase
MDTVMSADGTPIAYQRRGSGPPVVIVTGALNDRTAGASLARHLGTDHTVISYDRRGRGGSGDTSPYAIEREVEDLAAVVGRSGGAAAVFGYSSGAVLSLKAAVDGVAVSHLALYEPPFEFDDPDGNGPPDLPERLSDLVQRGRPGEAVALFLTLGIGMPGRLVAMVRRSAAWPRLEAMARSTVYDAMLTTTLRVPTSEMSALTTPTLVLNGAGTWPRLRRAARLLAGVLPAEHQELADGRNHEIPPASTAAAVRRHLRRTAYRGTGPARTAPRREDG